MTFYILDQQKRNLPLNPVKTAAAAKVICRKVKLVEMKATAKNPAMRKAVVKRAVVRKATVKKTAVRKAAVRKAVVTKAAVRKAAVKNVLCRIENER